MDLTKLDLSKVEFYTQERPGRPKQRIIVQKVFSNSFTGIIQNENRTTYNENKLGGSGYIK